MGAQISSAPDIMGGSWVIDGTRVTVSSIKEFWDAGFTVAQIRGEYPSLDDEQIMAAVSFERPRGRVNFGRR